MQGCVWIQWSSLAHYASKMHHPFSLGALLKRMRDGEGPPRRKRRWTVALHVTSRHYELSLFASWAKHSPTCRLIYGANIDLSVKTVNLSSMFDVAPFKIQSAVWECWAYDCIMILTLYVIFSILSGISVESLNVLWYVSKPFPLTKV